MLDVEITLSIIESNMREGGQRGLSYDEAIAVVWARYDLAQLDKVFANRRQALAACRVAYEQGVEEYRAAWPVYFTTAPEGFDGFGTVHRGVVGHDTRSKALRKVQINPVHREWQLMRYASGCCYTVDQAELDARVRSGLVTPA